MLTVEIAYAETEDVELIPLTVSAGTTVRDAINQSGICMLYPSINPDTVKTGIFGKLCQGDRVLEDGDRIELYRPLRADPKEARRRRAQRQKSSPK